MITMRTSRVSTLATATALLLGLGATGCGDSNDDADGSAANASGNQPADAASSDRRRAAAVMSTLRVHYNKGDGERFCALLTARGQREMSDWGSDFLKLRAPTCKRTISRLYVTFISRGGRWTPVRIKKLDLDGDKATVTMKGGLAGIRSIARFKLAKTNGNWKLVDPIAGTKTRKLP